MKKFVSIKPQKSIRDLFEFEYSTNLDLVIDLLETPDLIPNFSNKNLINALKDKKYEFLIVVFNTRAMLMIQNFKKQEYLKYEDRFEAIAMITNYFRDYGDINIVFDKINNHYKNDILIKSKVNRICDILIGESTGTKSIATIQKFITKSMIIIDSSSEFLNTRDLVILSSVFLGWILKSCRKICLLNTNK